MWRSPFFVRVSFQGGDRRALPFAQNDQVRRFIERRLGDAAAR
jgi:hypothetical protein